VKILSVLVIGTTVALVFLHFVRQQEYKERAALLACRGEAAVIWEGVEDIAAASAEWTVEARACADAARRAYEFIAGETVEELVTRDGQSRSSALMSGPEPDPQPAAATPKPAAAPAPKENARSQAPAGMLSREELDRRRAAAEGRRAPDPEPSEAAPEEGKPKEPEDEPAGEPAGEEEAPGEPPGRSERPIEELSIGDLTCEVLSRAEALEEADQLIRSAHAKVEALKDEVLGAATAVTAQKGMKPMRSLAASMQEDETTARQAIERVRAGSARAVQMHEEEAGRREQEKAEVERRRREAERRALVQKELARVRDLPNDNKTLVQALAFEDALRNVKTAAAQLTTREAKEAAGPIVDRYAYLAGLKAFLIERLNAEVLQWGWGFGASSVDVIGADASGVKLKTGTVIWADVSMKQMLKFIDHYIADKSIRMQTRGKQCLAAAILCAENGPPERVDTYSRKAAQFLPRLSEEAPRLLP